MRSQHILVVFLIGSLLAGCGNTADVGPPQEEPSSTPPPIGSPGNPVSSNSDWEPMFETIDGVEMALVPVGCFMMGDDAGRENEKPVHKQCVEEPFYIDVYEVSNLQYGKDVSTGLLDHPIVYIDWYEATAYCEGRGGRLPTEVEWEYAARGPDNLIYTWLTGRFSPTYLVARLDLGGKINYRPLAVGSKPAGVSWVGAQDMLGNVWEWTGSKFSDYPYDQSASIGVSASLDENESVVTRGNGAEGDEDFAFRAAYRRPSSPTNTSEFTGFRCIRPK